MQIVPLRRLGGTASAFGEPERLKNAVNVGLNRVNSPIVVVCGEVVPPICLADSAWVGSALEFVRCPEELSETLPLCEKLTPSVLVAGQAFLEKHKRPTIAHVSRTSGLRVMAVLKSHEGDVEDTTNLLRMGCRGVLPFRLRPGLFARAVLAVMAGEIWAPRLVLSTMLTEFLRANDQHSLTTRENEVFDLMRLGRKNSEIAETLFISRETVRWHIRRVHRKLLKPAALDLA